eukprot:749581-Hanusia_phi.AAC.5
MVREGEDEEDEEEEVKQRKEMAQESSRRFKKAKQTNMHRIRSRKAHCRSKVEQIRFLSANLVTSLFAALKPRRCIKHLLSLSSHGNTSAHDVYGEVDYDEGQKYEGGTT